MSDPSKVKVLVGTRKGGFIFTSDKDRKKWSISDIQFKGWNMMHMNMDPRDGRLHTSVSHFVYGLNYLLYGVINIKIFFSKNTHVSLLFYFLFIRCRTILQNLLF